MKDKVTLDEFNKALNEANEDKQESFEFTDADGNTQSIEFINEINQDLENIDEAKKYYSQKTLEAISEIPSKYPKKVNSVITAISNASKELVAQKKVLGQGLVIGFMVATGLAAIGKSDLANENSFGANLLKELGYEVDYIPVANDVTDYVASSINRAIKHYQEGKGTTPFSRMANFNDNQVQQNNDVYGMTQSEVDALNTVYGNYSQEEYQQIYDQVVAGEEVTANDDIKKQIVEYAEKDSEAISNEQMQFNNEQLEQAHDFENNMEEYQESGRSR